MLKKIYLFIISLIYFFNMINYGQITGGSNHVSYSEQSLDDSIMNEYAIINISSVPRNAKIFINDSSYGKLPLIKTILPIGDYKIDIIHNECNPVHFDMKLHHNEYTVNVQLENKFGYLMFLNKALEVTIGSDSVDIANEIRVEPGKKEFVVFDKKDSSWVKTKYLIKSNQKYIVGLNKKQFTPTNLLISTLFPGGGQILDGATLEGLGFTVPFLTSSSIYIYSKVKYNSEYKVYERSLSEYNLLNYYDLKNEHKIVHLKEEITGSKNRLNNLVDNQKLFGWISVGIYFLNIIDVIIFHTFFDNLEFTSEQYKFDNYEIGYKIKMKYNF